MESRKILTESGKLNILIDAENFLSLYQSNLKIKKLISYNPSEFYDFVKTPYNTMLQDIDKIQHFDNSFPESGNEGSVIFHENGLFKSGHLVTMMLRNVNLVCDRIYGNGSWSQDKWEKVWYVFVHSSWRDHNVANIFVTEDKNILKHREWFVKHVPGPVNVVTLDEAMEIMDIFAKSRGKYLIMNQFFANKGLWYWLSFRSKITYYNVPTSPDSSLHSLSYRFIFLLQSIDQMGINYYSEVNNDTGDSIQYHFNYFISLITGILDSLALETKSRYNITFTDDHIPSHTSLNAKAGKDFLKQVRIQNPDLRNLISKYAPFTNLIYDLREKIVHRNFQRPVTFSTLSGKNEANLIRIDNSISTCFNQLHDAKKPYDSYTEWGVYQTQIGIFLSPYEFSKKATKTLIDFTNNFLEKLGEHQYVTPMSTGSFIREIRDFNDNKLGF